MCVAFEEGCVVAIYKYPNLLSLNKSRSFDLDFKPGAFIPSGGIYRCTGCGTEIAVEGVGVFPDRTHHVHTPAQGPLAWRLVVASESKVPAPYLHGA